MMQVGCGNIIQVISMHHTPCRKGIVRSRNRLCQKVIMIIILTWRVKSHMCAIQPIAKDTPVLIRVSSILIVQPFQIIGFPFVFCNITDRFGPCLTIVHTVRVNRIPFAGIRGSRPAPVFRLYIISIIGVHGTGFILD